jgi:hypothetical protein
MSPFNNIYLFKKNLIMEKYIFIYDYREIKISNDPKYDIYEIYHFILFSKLIRGVSY